MKETVKFTASMIVVLFAAWLSEQELSDDDVEALKNDGKQVLIDLIEEYNYRLEEEDE